MLCSISDIYDAMRSQRAYQQAFPTERIIAVLKRNDGTQFDQHLVRRFVQLLGIYPPGNLVRLSTGEVAVVARVHAPDPYRPGCVLFDGRGRRLDLPFERNLWEPARAGDEPDSVVSPVDPADYAIDPLNFLRRERRDHVGSVPHTPCRRALPRRRLHLAGAAHGGDPVSSPDRLVAELRLAQVAALMLAACAAAYLGFAATHEHVPGAGLDVALALGFGLVAASTIVRDPRQALTMVALAFAAHAVLDVAHRPGVLPEGVVPRWYSVGCAIFNVYIGAVAYWPMLRR